MLTTRLARQAAAVAAVELDRTLEPVLAETLEGLDNVAVVYADALKTDLKALVPGKAGGPALEGMRQPAVQRNEVADHGISGGGLF